MPEPGIYVTSRVYDVLSETMSFTSAGTIEVDGAPSDGLASVGAAVPR